MSGTNFDFSSLINSGSFGQAHVKVTCLSQKSSKALSLH